MKRDLMSSMKIFVYELLHELPNDLKLKRLKTQSLVSSLLSIDTCLPLAVKITQRWCSKFFWSGPSLNFVTFPNIFRRRLCVFLIRIMSCFSLKFSRRLFGILELVLRNLSVNFLYLSKIVNTAGKLHFYFSCVFLNFIVCH